MRKKIKTDTFLFLDLIRPSRPGVMTLGRSYRMRRSQICKRRFNAACFCAVIFFIFRLAVGSPTVFVERTIAAQQAKYVLSGVSLPEMRSITFSCVFTAPQASIMDAIVSSPQPGTAVSVVVDTAASSMSISIRAVSSLLPADKSPIVIFTMNNLISGASWPITFAKALIIDKQGASVELPILAKTSAVERFACPSAFQDMQMPPGRVILFSLNGRRASEGVNRNATGYYLKSKGFACRAGIICVR